MSMRVFWCRIFGHGSVRSNAYTERGPDGRRTWHWFYGPTCMRCGERLARYEREVGK